MPKPSRVLNYNQQCLVAIARALSEDDEYRRDIVDSLENEADFNLVNFTANDGLIPCFCGTGEFDDMSFNLSLDQAIRLGEKSGLAQAYQRFWNTYWSDRPKAMFIRLSHPRTNVVVHTLNRFRTSWDPNILLYMPRHNGHALFVEKRTTFCKLLVRIGHWSYGHPDRLVAIYRGDDSQDMRLISHPGNLYKTAVRIAGGWGHRRTRSLQFRDLDNDAFVRKVMAMQMEKRVETGSW